MVQSLREGWRSTLVSRVWAVQTPFAEARRIGSCFLGLVLRNLEGGVRSGADSLETFQLDI